MTKYAYAEANLVPGAVELFQPVLDWLDQGAPHSNISTREKVGFNMEIFVFSGVRVKDYAEQNCGTACCIAGALHLFNPQLQLEFDSYVEEVGHGIGMDDAQVDALFYGIMGPSGEDDMALHLITPPMAAATIRRFLETGEIRWSQEDHACPPS